MGLFSKLFGKKKDIKGVNEFNVSENKAKVEKKTVVAPVEDDAAPKTSAVIKPEVVIPEKAKEEKAASPVTEEKPKEVKKPAEADRKKVTNSEAKTDVKTEPKKTVKTEEKSNSKANEKPTAKAASKATEKPTAKAASKATERPAEKAEAPTKDVKARTGRFEIKKTKDGRFVFNLYAPNHVIVATSQVYSSSTAAVNGIKSIINNAEKAPIEDNSLKNPVEQPFPKWEMYIDKGGQYRFRLFASNGSCVVHSQGYTAKNSCKKGIDSIIKCASDAEIDKSYLKKD